MAATTTAGTQDIALKGGTAAAAVVAAAEKRLADARAAAAAAAAEAPPPSALRDGPTLADRRAAAEESVATLTASLDALTKHLDAAERAAKAADAKASLLAELAAALSPYASAGAALRPEAAGDPVGAAAAAAALRAELAAAGGGGGGGVRSVGDAAGAGGVLDAAADLLDARAREAGADLAAAFDTLLVVRSGGVSLHPGAAVADALASVGGLPTALASVADRLRAGRVAAALRAATAFFGTDAGGGEVRYEWVLPPKGAPPPAGRGGPPPPPLEWEPADREAASGEVGVDDWAAMAAEPAVANACARALRLLDSTVTVVLGGGHARPAVDAWTGWALNEFFAPRAVLGRSPEGLARRVTAAAAASRVLEAALGARRRKAADGAAAGSEKGGRRGEEEEELTLAVQPGVLEAHIAGELRAQALLDARRSVSRFADAAAALAAGGGTSSALVPVPEAVSRAHPDLVGCRYSASASGVRDVAARTVRAAVAATRSGSAVVGGALAAAAADAVAAPARDVPLQYGEELGGGAPPALRLAAVHYVDCRVLSAAAGALATAASPTVADAAGALGGAANTLSVAADAAVAAVVADATAAIRAGVSAAGGAAGDLGAYGTLAGLARSAGLRSAVTALRAPVGAWAGLAPPPTVRSLAGVLGAAYLNALADATRGCPDISEAACDVLTGVLQDGLSAAAGVMECVPEGGAGGGGGAAAAAAFPPTLAGGGAAYAAAVARAGAVVRVLNARMEDIIGAFRAGQYGDALSRADVEAYVTAIFEDSPLRAQFLADLDAPEEDGDDWGWK